MPTMKGGEIIAEHLVAEGVPYIFGICGHGNVGILDPLHAMRDRIKLISPRHEQIAGHMADAYFRVSHRPVATLTSTGPGSANIVMPLMNALADSSAVLAITANVPTSQAGRGPFQELYWHNQADFPQVMRPLVKRSFQPTRVDMLPLALRQAFNTLTDGRPGPVHLDVPYNVFQEQADVPAPAPRADGHRYRPGAGPEELARAMDLVRKAERPVLFIGHGVTLSDAAAELVEFARALNIPVVSSPNGMGCIPMGDPLSLGFIGRNGTYPANQAGRHADLVIAIGARFDDRSASSWLPGYSWNIPPANLLHVDVDPKELGRNYPPTLGVLADARTFLTQIHEGFAREGTPDPARLAGWHRSIAGWREEWEAFIRPNFDIHAEPIRPQRVVADARAVLADDAIISLDSGVHHNWFMQFWEARQPRTMLNAWGFSAMGFGVSGILGAKLAAPDRTCVSFCGDGGFMMTPQVLATAVEYDIPAVWVVWNNFAWGAIRDIQHGMFEGREIGTAFYQGENREPYNPDFAALARAHGVEGVTVTKSRDFKDALAHAVAADRPMLLDVHVDADVRPPAIGAWQLPPTPYKEPALGARYLPD